ncbi:hypothetical protein [Candidatus Venteria ishoeyi]|uniref:DnaJ domain protein n=1 Tax=Candidatus Venteria ishoeyi TaxID=1899563 RepID=A0A1H6FGX0_9GAMM|nr:hypothetical protein [Candidatus Venteria ishoeyi]SEH08244.1 Uncharacterised protein [Candidatus Venteria ishoeyi]
MNNEQSQQDPLKLLAVSMTDPPERIQERLKTQTDEIEAALARKDHQYFGLKADASAHTLEKIALFKTNTFKQAANTLIDPKQRRAYQKRILAQRVRDKKSPPPPKKSRRQAKHKNAIPPEKDLMVSIAKGMVRLGWYFAALIVILIFIFHAQG